MTNAKSPASKTAKTKKLLLFPGDPLIKTLKPEYYIVVDPSTLTSAEVFDLGGGGNDGTDKQPDEPDEPDDPTESDLEAPNLEDIILISKTLVTDGNKNQYIEFKFNIKNHVGEAVIGAEGYVN